MYNTISIGDKTEAIVRGKPLRPYTRVKVYNDEKYLQYTAGDSTGRQLTVQLIDPTQEAADNLLAIVKKWPAYRPFEATSALLDPSADLGDIVSVGGVTSGIFSLHESYGGEHVCDVAAPFVEDIDHEIPFRSASSRSGGRAIRKAEEAKSDVLEAHNQLVAALTMQAGAPVDLAAGLQNYVRYDLKNDEGYAGTRLFSQIGEKARSEISVYTVIDSQGNAKSFATMLADEITMQSHLTSIDSELIELDGRVDLTGVLSIQQGALVCNGSIYAPGNAITGETVNGTTVQATIDLVVRGAEYAPETITSTTGTVAVLGAA